MAENFVRTSSLIPPLMRSFEAIDLRLATTLPEAHYVDKTLLFTKSENSRTFIRSQCVSGLSFMILFKNRVQDYLATLAEAGDVSPSSTLPSGPDSPSGSEDESGDETDELWSYISMASTTHGLASEHQLETFKISESRADQNSFVPQNFKSSIPGITLVICFNVASLQKVLRFNSSAKVNIFFSVVYSLYALFGIIAGIALRYLAINQRLRSLIILYWILIASTVIEGTYFGIVMSEKKSKLVSYCKDDTASRPGATVVPATPSNSTIDSLLPAMACHKAHTLIGVFYILGPCGWIALHIGWILVVVLYSKALRKQNPVDEEMAVRKLDSRSMSHRVSLMGGQRKSDGTNQNDFDLRLPSSSFRAVLRTIKPRAEIGQDQLKNNPLQNIDNDNIQNVDQDQDLSDSEFEEAGNNLGHGHRKLRSFDVLDESMPPKTDIPVDGKGWWIRQIEGKRRA
ncbi:hypothetical protein BGX27_009562 [Mortierella sp. AM989]|nr:hypothetical protein BGX27_009562 [Mortierella sp. AM989]